MRKLAGMAVALALGWAAVAGYAQAPAAGGAAAPASEAPAKAAATVEATPALWKLKGAHGTVYLFGSVHMIKPNVHWETAKVKEALTASDVLYLEIAGFDDEAVKAMQPEILSLGVDKEHPLSSKISKEDVAMLDEDVKALGMPGEQAFEPMQPWLAYVTLSVLPVMKAGYDPNSGIDKALEAEAKTVKKPVKGFETVSEQIHFLSDMPMALQTQMLHQTLVDMPKSVAQIDTMVGDWTKGDVEAIGKLDNDEMKGKYPELYKALLLDRNIRFADALAGILKDPATRTVFAAIGAAHLAGPDSVQGMLAKKGYAAERVE